MKFFSSELIQVLMQRSGRRNLRLVLRFIIFLVALIAAYSILFHVLMAMEGRSFSWFTGVYWTLTVMSTLGFGDITFHTDLGRVFSSIVLLSGMLWLLVMMPFVFMEFFYQPWIKAQLAARTPRKLSDEVRNHVIILNEDPITVSLIQLLNKYQYKYVLLEEDPVRAANLQDEGYKVIVGDMHSPDTYRKIHVHDADMLVATADDKINTNAVFTARELNKKMSIVSSAKNETSVDILKLAGSSHVLEMGKMMGGALARRMLAGGAFAHIIGRFEKLLIAEALCAGTPLVGKTIAGAKLRETVGVSIIGVWEKSAFKVPAPDMEIGENTVLVLAGSADQIKRYDELFVIYHVVVDPVVIIGGGRVGRATGEYLERRKIAYRIIEPIPERIRSPQNYVLGDAADLEILKKAGIEKAPAVIITTRDDDTNVYLAIFIRRIRPDIQIISRATFEKNVPILHRAGADLVMSYASMGSHAIFNLLKRSDVLMLTEGILIFQMAIPKKLVGKSLLECDIRNKTGCTLVAVKREGEMDINPDPNVLLPENADIVLISNEESQYKFLQIFGDHRSAIKS